MTLVQVGTPPSGYQAQVTNSVVFHEFASLPASAGHCVSSPKFSCFGHQWSLQLYPGGFDEEKKEMIAVFLNHASSGKVSVRYSFTVKDADGDISDAALKKTFDGPYYFGFPRWTRRSSVLKSLVNGSLFIQVPMTLVDSLPFIPKNPTLDALDFFLGAPADVVLEVGGNKKRRSTRSSLDPTIVEFRAHRFVVAKHAPKLLKSKVSEEPEDDVERVSIPIVKPEVFRHVLRYVYGGEVPTAALEDHSKEIVEAASHYKMTSLKLTAEAWYVQAANINEDTLQEHLVFANKHQLALLLEGAVDFINDSGCEIRHLMKHLPAKLKADLLVDIHRANQKACDKFSKMRVNELRSRLEEKGLDIGESKDAMVDALREASTSDEVTVCAANLGKMKV